MTSKKEYRDHKGKTASNVNPQGYSEDVANQRPKTELEDRAKKTNTKI